PWAFLAGRATPRAPQGLPGRSLRGYLRGGFGRLFAERWMPVWRPTLVRRAQVVVGVHHGRGIRGRGESTAHTRIRAAACSRGPRRRCGRPSGRSGPQGRDFGPPGVQRGPRGRPRHARGRGVRRRQGSACPGFLDGRGGTRRPVPTRADRMTPGQLATEEAKGARTVAAYAMVRAMLARYTWTMARILDRWAAGSGTEGMDFAAAVAGAGAALTIGMAGGNRTAPWPRRTRR